ncbi:MAG TPA: peptidoglycan-binding protein LysM [Flavobacteriaceae bacterium]|nr:peptidoglycan-binding protein LysM [Flavobacteriaceae bacterium]
MRKKIIKFSVLPLLATFLLFGFSGKKDVSYKILAADLPEFYFVPVKSMVKPSAKTAPRLNKNYIGFREAVGFKESQGRYWIVNQFGYIGKYQFGKGTLKMLGIYNTEKFRNSPELQEAAFYANASRNKWILRREIKKYVGTTINGVKITESGILAAAHLAGPGGVKSYLRSGGRNYFSDAFGTTISSYLKKFQGYNTSNIVPNRLAKAH